MTIERQSSPSESGQGCQAMGFGSTFFDVGT
jgi:hypothetical protein